ncbi:MAG TPA: hypothetical protein VFK37_02335 [Bacillales bacterium]|nr:hypothetical protein [Bacillales bacterium]
MNRMELAKKVRKTAGTLLYEKGYVSPVDLMLGMDKLSKEDYDAWRKKKVSYLERVLKGNLNQLNFILKQLKNYGKEHGLKPSKTVYRSWGKGAKVNLRFSKSGNNYMEEAYSTHFVRIKK